MRLWFFCGLATLERNFAGKYKVLRGKTFFSLISHKICLTESFAVFWLSFFSLDSEVILPRLHFATRQKTDIDSVRLQQERKFSRKWKLLLGKKVCTLVSLAKFGLTERFGSVRTPFFKNSRNCRESMSFPNKRARDVCRGWHAGIQILKSYKSVSNATVLLNVSGIIMRLHVQKPAESRGFKHKQNRFI